MFHALDTFALWISYALVGTAVVVVPLAALVAVWWWIAGKVIDHVWTLTLFYDVAVKVLNERKTPDQNQLTRWPPRKRY